ncbi:Metacaspase-1A, partial [Neolecta irregularis DAH-3]
GQPSQYPPPPSQYGQPSQYPPPPVNYQSRPQQPCPQNLDRLNNPPPDYHHNAYVEGNSNAPPIPPTSNQYMNYPNGQQYHFQYSNCTGRRKALLIGINYFGTKEELKGCINDVLNMSKFLSERYNYKEEDMVILRDDSSNPQSLPTRANIIRAMYWLVNDARPNDSLFFHYSGHGGQTEDLDGDEDDGFDEVIYSMDFKATSHIVDDEMHAIMVSKLPAGCRLTAIFDSCHSGTALDLPFVYSTQGILKEPNMLANAGKTALGAGMSYLKGDMRGVFTSVKGLLNSAKGNGAVERARQTKMSHADAIQFSGCKGIKILLAHLNNGIDSQTSADAYEAGTATGAMSWAFREALKKYPQTSYQGLLVAVRNELQGKYSQLPQLSSSHPIDTNLCISLYRKDIDPLVFIM